MASSSSVSDHPEEESIISYTFSRGYTYEVITEFLAKCHGITTCVRTLKNTGCRLKYLNFKEKIAIYFDMDVVQEQTMNELSGPGSPIRGCNYGWSRKIMWRTVTRSNNHPEIIVNFYLNCVAGLESSPVKLRTDCGTESGVMAALQGAFQQDAEAHKYGSSPVNQRIEGWWVFYGRNSCCKACRKRLEYERSA